MTFGTDWGWGADETSCRDQVTAFAEAGGNFIDTADKYTDGSAERLIGQIVADDRDRWVIATKYGLFRDAKDPNSAGNHRKNLRLAVEASLRRLGTDYVDVLYVHAWDFLSGVDEVLQALADQVRSGNVLYLGLSDTPAWVAAQVQTVARQRGWPVISALQVQYSLVQRDPERELLPAAAALRMTPVGWAPLGGGVLSGKFLDASQAGDTRRGGHHSERHRTIAQAVLEVAAELGAAPAQVALAWSSAHGVIPVIGARTAEQLEQSLGYTDVELSTDQLTRLDAVSAEPRGWPHDFVDDMTDLIYGPGFRDRIDPA
jgi:aryl-alcohol dehydrogenase-like predicted oxidoreductase